MFAGRDGCPSCSTHTQTREFVTSARTNDPPTILELARFGKIEANHIVTIALPRTKRWMRSARGRSRDKVYSLVLRLFRCFSAGPRPCRETAAPAKMASPAQHQVLRAPP